ncbi:MAG: CGNR zinc finger domain-containing protein [Micromonosporaceae bacterium]
MPGAAPENAASERGAPEHALLLRDFVNTLDLDEATDELSDTASLVTWLSARGLIAHGSRGVGDGAGEADLEAAIALRTSLRSAMRAHHETRGQPAGLDAAAGGFPLRVSESSGTPTLVPAETGVRGALGWLAAAIVASAADHTWERLKICADDTCQWAFLDSSKNRSKHWCSMRECGNRAKTRAYRARRAGRGPDR